MVPDLKVSPRVCVSAEPRKPGAARMSAQKRTYAAAGEPCPICGRAMAIISGNRWSDPARAPTFDHFQARPVRRRLPLGTRSGRVVCWTCNFGRALAGHCPAALACYAAIARSWAPVPLRDTIKAHGAITAPGSVHPLKPRRPLHRPFAPAASIPRALLHLRWAGLVRFYPLPAPSHGRLAHERNRRT